MEEIQKLKCISNSLQSTEYYSNGRLYRVSQPTFTGAAVQWATTYYDTYGRTSSTTSPKGTTTVTYNATEDNMTVKTPDNMTKTTVWNTAGQVSKVLTNDKAVEYTYTAGNNVKTAKSGTENFIVQKEYDLQGNLTKETDPDLGTKEYSYDGWGQLKIEKTTKQGQMYSSVTYNYNALGLLTSKVRGGETTTYTYDTYKRIQSISLSNGKHQRSFEYGSFDRIISTTDFICGKRLTTGKGYDSYGRVRTETYPTGYYTVNTYDSCGFLRKITDNSSRLIWQLDSCDAAGRVLKETKGSTITRYTYDAAGRILTILSPGFINSAYTYYPTGNVKTFTDLISNQTETYKYDNMDRLLDWRSHSASYLYENCMEYSESANRIFIKSDYAWAKNISHTYSYPAVATTASNTMMSTVTSAIGTSYAIPPTHSINYTGFKKVKYLSQGTYGESITFEYGVDEQRIYAREDHRYGMERYYLGNYEEEYGIYGSDESKIHYIYGGNGLAAVYKGTATTGTLYSAYTDRQGSLVALARGTTLAQRYAYDPWGNRRSPSNWRTKDESGSGGLIVRRGYTLHEHLPEFGLINMNGRMYDPLTCTFMSPDPYIQDPTNWLNYNRYAYCMNNPLKYTDPSGEFWWVIPVAIGAYLGGSAINGNYNPFKWDYGNWQTYAGIGIGGLAGFAGAGVGAAITGSAIAGGSGVIGAGAAGGMIGGMAAGAISGAGMTAIRGGSLDDVLGGMTTGMVMGGFGGALSGGVNAAIGDFSGVSGGAFKNSMYELGHSALKGAATGLAGGAMMAAMEQDASYLWKGAATGAALSTGMAGLRIGLMGSIIIPLGVKERFAADDAAYGIKSSYPVYRRGGLLTLFTPGIALGRSMMVDSRFIEKDPGWYHETLAHERAHIYQQRIMGKFNFYKRVLYEYLINPGYSNNPYRNPNCLDYWANQYMYLTP